MIVDWDAEIALDDGAMLRADVYRPAGDGRYPVLMNLGPYCKGYAFQEYAPIQWQQLTAEHPEVLADTSNRYAQWEVVDPEKWVPHGYAVVRVDARGTGRSPGFMDPWSARERRDYSAAIEWAAAQPWSTGKIGLSGISYHAANQWMVATAKPPHLAAICVWEGMSDFYRDAVRHGGILCDFWKFWIGKQAAKMQHGLGSRGARSRVTGRYVTGDADLDDATLARNRSSFADSLIEEFDGPFYRERSADTSAIDVPVLSAGNWGGQGLHLRGNVEGFLACGSRQKWLEIHGLEHWTEYFTDYGTALQRRFFDCFLKGLDNGFAAEPRVQLQIRSPGGFTLRGENEWPLARTHWTTLYLHLADRTLRPEAPPDAAATASFEALCGAITFMSAPLQHETEITGPSAAKLWLSSSTRDADIFLVLRAFDPDGTELLFSGATDPHAPIGQGWLRASHRKLDAARSLPYRPFHTHDEKWPLTPGAAVETDVEIWPTCIVLPAGYRIALTVQGRDYDEGERAEISNSGNVLRGSGVFVHTDPVDRDPRVFGGTTTLHSGPACAPRIILPVIPSAKAAS